MFSENSRKILWVMATSLIFLSACSFWRKTEDAAPTPTPPVVVNAENSLPFASKEPEKFQAEIMTQTFAGGEKDERKILTARSGNRRLTIFNSGEKSETASLILENGTSFSIYKAQKIYAQNANGQPNSADANVDFLTTEWLSAKTSARFENLGTENDLTKFRARLSDSENSEMLIYFDEKLQIPVKQEFYAVSGEQKTLAYTVEVKNFTTETDEKLFELPKDFRQISPQEFAEIVWWEKLKR